MKHRKLILPSSLAETNYSSTDCSGLCDPACPYNCYPDYYYLPPPPPPQNSAQIHHISPFVMGVVSFLAGLFLLFSYYVVKTKPWTGWCGNQRSGAETGWDEDFIDENRVDHPVWFIATVGLQPSVINSISVWKYKEGERVIEGTECSVCLSEFREDEMLRLLPKCNHAFHVSCIDTWLRSHTNCPLCRAGIVFDVIRNSPVMDRSSDSVEGISGVDSGIRRGLDVGRERIVGNGENFEDRGRIEDAGEVPKEKEKGKLIRSFSADSLATENLGFVSEDDRRTTTGVKFSDNSASVSEFLRVNPVPIKRSFSCSGKFLLPKQGRSLNVNVAS